MSTKNKFYTLAGIFVIATVLNYTVYLQTQISQLNNQLKLCEMQAQINRDWANDVTWSGLNGQTEEMLRGQGRLEGIVNFLDPETKDAWSISWHEGYQRGLNQNEDMIEMTEKRSFAEGYKQAKSEAGNETEIIPPSAKPVNSRAIKTPDFDESTGKVLPDSDTLRKELNEKFSERLKSETNPE